MVFIDSESIELAQLLRSSYLETRVLFFYLVIDYLEESELMARPFKELPWNVDEQPVVVF
jgi:hypothetical protein